MRNLSATVAVYPDLATAEADWAAVESAAYADAIDLADAALVEKGADGAFRTTHRQSHHGWGKGAVAGAVVGVLFPPALAGVLSGADATVTRASSTAEEVREALDADPPV